MQIYRSRGALIRGEQRWAEDWWQRSVPGGSRGWREADWLDPHGLAGTALDALAMLHHELALFACFWLIIGLVDDLLIDLVWLWLVARGMAQSRRLPPGFAAGELTSPMAVFIPAWQEADVIGTTVRHALAVWPQAGLRLYVGCYGNDPATAQAAIRGAGGDRRLRVVTVAALGPTTKADCLNRLYRALARDESRGGAAVRAVVLHDAEDMVHPAELALFERALGAADFVQLPVRAEPLASSRWIAGHYLDEFSEAHTKTLVVRDALGGALPAAGVGCAIRRSMLDLLAEERRTASRDGEGAGSEAGPFAPECLTEDYEIGWRIARAGGRARFLRRRDHAGDLVATRAFFPDTLHAAVRQKARWTHGIAYQGWDRLGWAGSPVDVWMALRDRRAPMSAAVLVAAYACLLTGLLLTACGGRSLFETSGEPGWIRSFQLACGAGLIWRLLLRALYSAHEYGGREGLRALVRALVANVIAIASAHRALRAYLRTLGGGPAVWDKTTHRHHPATDARA